MRVAYIVHDLADAAVKRRRMMLSHGGATVATLGFRRAPAPKQPGNVSVLEIGVTRDAALAQRAMMVARHCVRPGRVRKGAEKAEVVVARGLEQLAMARRIVGERPLVYECHDIHCSLLGDRPHHRLLRRVEARLLPRVDLLLTSSPGLVSEYFAHRPGLRAPAVLVEDKLLWLDGAAPHAAAAPAGPPWTIGWFGMLRCRRTLRVLATLARALDGRVKILIAGRPSAALAPDLATAVADGPHLRFLGEYAPGDLRRLYAQCHFAWAIDWFEQGLNSDWLLPNRVYEASAFGVVPIVMADVEAGRWLAGHKAGLRVGTADEIAGPLRAMTAERYAAMRAAIHAIPSEALLATQADCTALVARLAGLIRR